MAGLCCCFGAARIKCGKEYEYQGYLSGLDAALYKLFVEQALVSLKHFRIHQRKLLMMGCCFNPLNPRNPESRGLLVAILGFRVPLRGPGMTAEFHGRKGIADSADQY